jgi:DNA-binding MarR family transcriptional regulator
MVNNIPVEGASMSRGRIRLATPPTRAAGRGGEELSRGMLPELLGYRLRRAQTAVFKHFASVVGTGESVTPGLFGMMQVIAANPGLSQSRLAEAMDVDRSTIVAVMHRLEGLGFVARTPSRRDQRSYALQFTRRGWLALRRIEARVLRHEQELAGVFSAAERRTLMDLLARLYERVPVPASPARPRAVKAARDAEAAS